MSLVTVKRSSDSYSKKNSLSNNNNNIDSFKNISDTAPSNPATARSTPNDKLQENNSLQQLKSNQTGSNNIVVKLKPCPVGNRLSSASSTCLSRKNSHSFSAISNSKLNSSSSISSNSSTSSSTSLSSRNNTLNRKNYRQHLIEKYFVVKDAALILPKRLNSNVNNNNNNLYSWSLGPCPTCLSLTCSSGLNCTTQTAIANNNNNTAISATTATSAAMSSASTRTSQPSSTKKPTLLNENITQSTGDILLHLQSMISLLRADDTIILAVKLSSYIPERIRYLVIVETKTSNGDESAVLGIDLFPNQSNTDENLNDSISIEQELFICSVGLVLPIYANCDISLDGDGGFIFKSHLSMHIFKPVSIQGMWSAYQFIHRAFENARRCNFFPKDNIFNSLSPQNDNELIIKSNISATSLTNVLNLHQDNHSSHEWVKHYLLLIGKYLNHNNSNNSILNVNKLMEQNYINEWYQKEERSAQRQDFTTPYFDSLLLCKEQEEVGLKIKDKLREIFMRSKDDYGSMSSVSIREMLERELKLKLDNFKKFIDATIFQFYNQLVESATEILPYLYLGTEWNASNYDSLIRDRVTHILNVSSEVDNFFPDSFKYLNIRVIDIEETDLLKEFDRSNKFIQEAKEQGSSCLVHCKMGVSRSASIVLAYLMKESNLSFNEAFTFAKQKRSCINPNMGFREQLLTYESILTAHKAKYSVFEPLQMLVQTQNQPQQQILPTKNSQNKLNIKKLNPKIDGVKTKSIIYTININDNTNLGSNANSIVTVTSNKSRIKTTKLHLSLPGTFGDSNSNAPTGSEIVPKKHKAVFSLFVSPTVLSSLLSKNYLLSPVYQLDPKFIQTDISSDLLKEINNSNILRFAIIDNRSNNIDNQSMIVRLDDVNTTESTDDIDDVNELDNNQENNLFKFDSLKDYYENQTLKSLNSSTKTSLFKKKGQFRRSKSSCDKANYQNIITDKNLDKNSNNLTKGINITQTDRTQIISYINKFYSNNKSFNHINLINEENKNEDESGLEQPDKSSPNAHVPIGIVKRHVHSINIKSKQSTDTWTFSSSSNTDNKQISSDDFKRLNRHSTPVYIEKFIQNSKYDINHRRDSKKLQNDYNLEIHKNLDINKRIKYELDDINSKNNSVKSEFVKSKQVFEVLIQNS